MEVGLLKTLLTAAPDALEIIALIGVVMLFLKAGKGLLDSQERQNKLHHEQMRVIGQDCHDHQEKLAQGFEKLCDRQEDSARNLGEILNRNTQAFGLMAGVIRQNGGKN